jgi:hypothetical protein
MQLLTKNNSLFLSRVSSFIVFTVILSQLNLWVSATVNALFIILGRVILITSPLLYKTCKPRSLSVINLFMVLSIAMLLIKFNIACIIVLACTIALLGYFQKLFGSHSFSGAGSAKIAANVGSLVGGFLLFFLTYYSKSTNLIILLCFSLIGLVSNFHYENQGVSYDYISLNQDYRLTRLRFAWCLFGIAIGIKFYAIFTLLPQIIIRRLDVLPNWYGVIVVVNSLGIILGQKAVVKLVKKWQLKHFYFLLSLGLVLIGSAPMFNVEYWVTAVIWTILLTFVECVISAMDSMSALQGALLYKEISIGIGGAFVALFARSHIVDPFVASMLLGLAAISIGYYLYYSHEKESKLLGGLEKA